MNSLDTIMKEIRTEAIEGSCSGRGYGNRNKEETVSFLPIHYTLELVENHDGTYGWIE